ncbi:MAG: ABC transporter ATP-binding protein [Lachnospiraceae bacterium]|nr:ABC transporter ATP-binding protein [Lachnospiraceae bacterium]
MGVLEFCHVSYYYEKDRMILKDLQETFERGKIYVSLGPSGCGKTTVLSLLGGLDVPKQGAVLFEGEDIQKKGLEDHRRSSISFVFQNYNLIDYMTPEENVKLTAAKDAVLFLEKVGLTKEECRRNVRMLSGGQQQRVAIARALASDNPVILADEPTGNLDEDTAMEIMALFREAAKVYHKCVIIVSHSSEVAKQADTVLVLKQGKLKCLS